MTDEELQEIRERAGRATPGPWEALKPFGMEGMHHSFLRLAGQQGAILARVDTDVRSDHAGIESDPHGRLCAANSEFIAASRTDIPRLLDEIGQLKNFCANLNRQNVLLMNELPADKR